MQAIYTYIVLTVIRQLPFIFALFVFVGVMANGFGQSIGQVDTVYLDIDKDLASQLLPFESIYELAQFHSPVLKQQNADIESKAAAIQSLKWTFLSGVGLTSGLTRGNQSVVTNDNSNYPLLSLSNGYRFGFNANISVGDLLSRRPNIRQAQATQKFAMARRDVLAQELRRELYRIYQATLLSQRMLRLYIEGQQVALVAFQTAEINWKENRLAASDYSSASQLYTQAQAKVEGERVAVSMNLFDLVTLAGVPMAQLQRLQR
ncbi:hypothetical protein CWM47_30200 [Spirosoma pollinicola]|uniref:Transporter n=2 Tax=Spirosoma pollinicola TaxID=2057025 RepID=A0A2K8Z794_9BACT|nr:hypothetical protein CWM47_30200 [Spirosoma pollinicola]